MPFSCLVFNFAWEIMATINSIYHLPYFLLLLVWALLGLVILIIHYVYGNIIINKRNKTLFYSLTSALPILVTVLFIILSRLVLNFDLYSTFVINVYMSLIFLLLLGRSKKYIKGLVAIGIFRMIGTLCASITYSFYDGVDIAIIIAGLFILLIDFIYVGLSIKNKDVCLIRSA